jgi:DinB superfamily
MTAFRSFVLLIALTVCAAAQTTGETKMTTLIKEDRDFGVQYLKDTRQQLLEAVAGLSDAQMKFKAAPDKWSIAEIVEHLVNAENAVFMVTQQIIKTPLQAELQTLVKERVMKSPVPVTGQGTNGLLVKDQTIILTATNRTTRKFQAPEPVAPRGKLAAKAELLAAFDKARARTIAFLETTDADLRSHFAEHWVLGVLDAYQWLLFVTAHSERHIAQLNEVKTHAAFPRQ